MMNRLEIMGKAAQVELREADGRCEHTGLCAAAGGWHTRSKEEHALRKKRCHTPASLST